MRIEKIILSNFRIYAGRNELFFGHRKEKNITLIAGKNGFGKTTFLTSLIWGMYGNLMAQVEDKYRRDIKNAGGYDAYLKTLLNLNVLDAYEKQARSTARFFVEIDLVDVMIPSIPCKKVVIRRAFDLATGKEELSILIDGQENELTKEVGYDAFINDFILPREIAKFFFFDAEKIVSLAEAKTKHELRTLSKAYSEVLGIKKYEDLKLNLATLLTKLKRAGVSEKDEAKMAELELSIQDFNRMITLLEEQIKDASEEIGNCKLKIDRFQEQLIREGNEMSLEDLKKLKSDRERLRAQQDELKAELKKLMDYIPLAIASNRFGELVEQVCRELKIKQSLLGRSVLEAEYNHFGARFEEGLKQLVPDALLTQIGAYFDQLKATRLSEIDHSEDSSGILLDFDDETARKILATYDYLQHSFKTQFEQILTQEKEVRQELSRIQKKIKEGEARKDLPWVQKIREEKAEVTMQLEALELKKSKLTEELGAYRHQEASAQKVLSELLKKTTLLKTDKKKYDVTLELLDKLHVLTSRIKEEKKYALQKSLQLGLLKLMHKKDKIQDVRVRIEEDVMDIDLLDGFGKVIDKDTLSKGEQQLYATALLKALVDESGINFPVFIDSPLQKFDKEHSGNVIQQFYPTISDQVVLFPLLEKELSRDEFALLQPNLNTVHLIANTLEGSTILSCRPSELFTKFNEQHVLTY